MALDWLVGGTSLFARQPTSLAIVEAVARLAAVGVGDSDIVSVARQPIIIAGVWRAITESYPAARVLESDFRRSSADPLGHVNRAIIRAYERRNPGLSGELEQLCRAVGTLTRGSFKDILPGDQYSDEE